MQQYAQLHWEAAHTDVDWLHLPRSNTPLAWQLVQASCCSQVTAMALLHCGFVYQDLVAWLGGEFTNHERDLTKVEVAPSYAHLESAYR